MDTEKIRDICKEIEDRISKKHIRYLGKHKQPFFLISTEYPGIWLEHVYDAVFYGKNFSSQIELAASTINLFMEYQTSEGQYPYKYVDLDMKASEQTEVLGYTQVQEGVSFASLGYEVCKMVKNESFTKKVYESAKKWEKWLTEHRMTLGKGLIEMFVGYDSGHDGSGRLRGMSCPERYVKDGMPVNAGVLPPDDPVAPIIAVDMNANFYATQKALANLARMCGEQEEVLQWEKKATKIKDKIFELCYDEKDAFFYDIDKFGRKRKYLSSTIFHLFQEKVLDPQRDRELIEKLYKQHIKNPKEFWTEYPFPSMAICDPSVKNHGMKNCWGYYSQALIALRCTLWMDVYGFSDDFDYICQKWLEAWTSCFSEFKLGQELDPITGKPTNASEWYSSCMLFYLYAAKRLNLYE